MRREIQERETPLVDPNVEWTPEAKTTGSSARDRLLEAHVGLVKYLAHRIGSRLAGPIDYDDLAGDGLVGLIEAVDRFDPSHNVRFKTYAEARIRGAILDGIRGRDWAPRSLRRAGRKLEQAIASVERRTNQPASDDEIAEELQLSIEELQALYVQARGVRLGALPHTDEEGADPATSQADPLVCVEQKERRALVEEEVDNLPERERLVLGMYYDRRLTLKEIGEVLDVTESRVCQIHRRAVARLRSRISERLAVPEPV
ncbi:MAG: FliA/WhiG family RNA polymerase sigma factor [Acidobacteriota bacterium]|nr:FliA/WhiG family RNA polymerase sigma factor [Acidobacteriota bacterium]